MSVLSIEGLESGYGMLPVLHGLDLHVDEGELVTVIGANGAGKSTLLRTISGLNEVMRGDIRFHGRSLVRQGPAAIAAAGIAHVPENRRVFPAHTVEDNLLLGGYARGRRDRPTEEELSAIYERFPVLGERCRQLAGTLSGGEQQMLAIGMALMAKPSLLMLDEPSLGLAPRIVNEVFAHIAGLKRSGTTILLVEQIANQALQVADRGLVLQLGRVVAEGSADELRADPAVQRAYLGV